MSLKSLTSFISKTQVTEELIQRINKNNDLNVIGSSRYAKALIINGIASSEKKDILLISPSTEIAYKWYGYFQSIENEKVLYYPPNENLPYEDRTKSIEVEYAQLNIISQLISKETNKNFNRKIIITTERALQPHLINVEYFIVKRKLWENCDFPQKRIQQVRPAAGKPSLNKVMRELDSFISNAFTPEGKHNKESNYPAVAGPKKINCKWCEYRDREDLCPKSERIVE